jgi:hypothetical protein
VQGIVKGGMVVGGGFSAGMFTAGTGRTVRTSNIPSIVEYLFFWRLTPIESTGNLASSNIFFSNSLTNLSPNCNINT